MRAGRLPTALLLAGAPGVGKQRLGLWIAAGLVCEPGPGEPCGACHACHLASTLSHPDVHWFFPILRPKGEEDKQADEAEELLAQAVAGAARAAAVPAARRDGGASSCRWCGVLHRSAQMRPAMGKRKVFVVGEAERLVPQASSPEAANALLKVLEEPPPDTYFILTAAEPASLLPTIRSRLVQLRVHRLRASEVARFLGEVPQPPVAAGRSEAPRRAGGRLDRLGAGRGRRARLGGDGRPRPARRRRARTRRAPALRAGRQVVRRRAASSARRWPPPPTCCATGSPSGSATPAPAARASRPRPACSRRSVRSSGRASWRAAT